MEDQLSPYFASVARQLTDNGNTQSDVTTSEEDSSSPEAIKSWADLMRVHPAAQFFPMMPDDELLSLGKDIKENGLQEPIALFRPYEGGPLLLLDGRNRLAAIELAFGDPEERAKRLEDAIDRANVVPRNVEPEAYVVSLNIRRRHLTSEQKRELVGKLLEQNPERSDRATAKLALVSDKTVTSVRKGRTDIPDDGTRIDTKGRKQPARKAVNAESRSARPSSQQVRDKWVTSFLTTFHAKPFETLVSLQKILADKADWFEKIPKENRILLAQSFLQVLDVTPAELQEQSGGGQR